MTPEQKAAYVMGQAACLMAKVAGMQAENQYLAHCGMQPNYLERDFSAEVEKHACHHNAAIGLFHDG